MENIGKPKDLTRLGNTTDRQKKNSYKYNYKITEL